MGALLDGNEIELQSLYDAVSFAVYAGLSTQYYDDNYCSIRSLVTIQVAGVLPEL